MITDAWSRRAPWLGLIGSAVLVAALFFDPGTEVSQETEPGVVRVSRQQVLGSVNAAISETPSLRDEKDRLARDMEEGAIAQGLFVAEAFNQGLAISDYIVRNRMVELQVMSLYERADALVTPEAASEHFARNRERYRTFPRRYYLHLFVPVTNLVGEVEARERLEGLFQDDPNWGEPVWIKEDELRKSFGPTLARLVFDSPLSKWSEPYRSSMGWHYLMVLEEEPSRPFEFNEVAARATEDLRRELRREAYQEELARLKKKYWVEWTD